MDSHLRLTPLHFTSTTERVYTELRRLIIAGQLAPGQALNEKTVADQLGVSRSPVREAFQRLVTERLLLAERNKSVTVIEFTGADIREIYDARIAIETHAAQTITSAGPAAVQATVGALEDALRVLHQKLDTGDRLAIGEADLAFHQALVDAGGNSRLNAAYRLLSTEAMTCMAWLEHLHQTGDDLIQDHRDYIDALQTPDPARITSVIAEHLSKANTNLAACTRTDQETTSPASAP